MTTLHPWYDCLEHWRATPCYDCLEAQRGFAARVMRLYRRVVTRVSYKVSS